MDDREGVVMEKIPKKRNPVQPMPLNIDDETHQFIVTLAMSNSVLKKMLDSESISLSILGVRHITEEDLELLKVKEDEDDVTERVKKTEYDGGYEEFGYRRE